MKARCSGVVYQCEGMGWASMIQFILVIVGHSGQLYGMFDFDAVSSRIKHQIYYAHHP